MKYLTPRSDRFKEESGRKREWRNAGKFTRSSCASSLSVTCNNGHFNYPRSACASISMQIKEVAILLLLASNRDARRKREREKNEMGGERRMLREEEKKKTREKGKWSGIMRKSAKVRRMETLVGESGGRGMVEMKFERLKGGG